MLLSEEKRFVFIEVPKTGTTAVRKRLLELDPALVVNRVPTADGGWQTIGRHATAAEIRAAMGPAAEGYRFVAFLREPREIAYSKYYFYRQGRPWKKVRDGRVVLSTRGRDRKASLGIVARVAMARLLPFGAWASLYPFKGCAHFVCDARGRLIVDRLGDFATLEADCQRIFGEFGYPAEALRLSMENKTDYRREQTPTGLSRWLLSLKTRADDRVYGAARNQT